MNIFTRSITLLLIALLMAFDSPSWDGTLLVSSQTGGYTIFLDRCALEGTEVWVKVNGEVKKFKLNETGRAIEISETDETGWILVRSNDKNVASVKLSSFAYCDVAYMDRRRTVMRKVDDGGSYEYAKVENNEEDESVTYSRTTDNSPSFNDNKEFDERETEQEEIADNSKSIKETIEEAEDEKVEKEEQVEDVLAKKEETSEEIPNDVLLAKTQSKTDESSEKTSLFEATETNASLTDFLGQFAEDHDDTKHAQELAEDIEKDYDVEENFGSWVLIKKRKSGQLNAFTGDAIFSFDFEHFKMEAENKRILADFFVEHGLMLVPESSGLLGIFVKDQYLGAIRKKKKYSFRIEGDKLFIKQGRDENTIIFDKEKHVCKVVLANGKSKTVKVDFEAAHPHNITGLLSHVDMHELHPDKKPVLAKKQVNEVEAFLVSLSEDDKDTEHAVHLAEDIDKDYNIEQNFGSWMLLTKKKNNKYYAFNGESIFSFDFKNFNFDTEDTDKLVNIFEEYGLMLVPESSSWLAIFVKGEYLGALKKKEKYTFVVERDNMLVIKKKSGKNTISFDKKNNKCSITLAGGKRKSVSVDFSVQDIHAVKSLFRYVNMED